MDRLACVNVAAFPLQLLLCAHPEWAGRPVAVVENDRPQAAVLAVNAHARRLGVRTGQRYATALSLALDLHAGTVSSSQLDRGIRMIADRLRRYSPHVEPSIDMTGVFWLDASGLRHLYPSLEAWADLIRVDLQQEGMFATLAVGFSRFGTYALAVSRRDVIVCPDADDERSRVSGVPLARLSLEPDARDRLLALGIETVGDFLRLPTHGIRARFGAATDALHQLASGMRWAPLVPVPAGVRYRDVKHFETPEENAERLLFALKEKLDPLVARVSRSSQAIVEVVLWMKLDDRSTRTESVTPAAATIDVAQLLTLVRLRLDALQLPAGVVTLRIEVNTCASTAARRGLLPEHTRRDADAANRALARVRAECGDESVVRASIRDAHLPSARFIWEPMTHVAEHSSPRSVSPRPLVRRIFAKPVPLPSTFQLSANIHLRGRERARDVRRWRFVHANGLAPSRDSPSTEPPAGSLEQTGAKPESDEPSGSQVTRGTNGPVAPIFPTDAMKTAVTANQSPIAEQTPATSSPRPIAGPYVISGGWWGGGVRRDYYYVHTASGETWWIYFDHRRQRFFLQGAVE